MSRIKRLTIEGSWIVIGQIAAGTGALALVRVLTEYLDPSEYGRLALGLTVAGLIGQFVMGGIGAGVGRFYSIAAEQRDLSGYFSAARKLVRYTTMVGSFIGLMLMTSLYLLGYSHWVGLAAVVSVFSLLSAYNVMLNIIQTAARRRVIVAFHSGLDAWLKVGLAFGMLLWLGASSTVVMIGYICASSITIVSQLILLRRAVPQWYKYDPKSQKWLAQMWAFSLPSIIYGSFLIVQQISDRWALQAFASLTEVGEYAVLFQLGYIPVTLIANASLNLIGPILYQHSGDATDSTRNAYTHQLCWRITNLSFVVTFVGFVIAFVTHKWYFSLFAAAGYREISYLLPWVVLAGGIFSAGQILTLKLQSEMNPTSMTKAKIYTALIGIALNLIGAALAGTKGVVAALVVFSTINVIWMALLARRARFR